MNWNHQDDRKMLFCHQFPRIYLIRRLDCVSSIQSRDSVITVMETTVRRDVELGYNTAPDMNRSSEVSRICATFDPEGPALCIPAKISHKHSDVCVRGSVIMHARIDDVLSGPPAFRKLSRRRGQLGRTLDRIPLKAPNRWHNDGLIGSSLTTLLSAGARLLRFIAAWLALIDGSYRWRTQSLESYCPAAFRELRGSSIQLLRLLLCYRSTRYHIIVIGVDGVDFQVNELCWLLRKTPYVKQQYFNGN